MTDMIMELTGVNSSLEVYNDKIIIKRGKGYFGGDKTIYLNQVTGIELKEAGSIISGYIQFTIPGSVSASGTFHAARNENSVLFRKKYNDEAEEIKLKIEDLIKNQSKSNDVKMDNTDLIRKYKQLFDDGIITQEEFQAKKKEILGL